MIRERLQAEIDFLEVVSEGLSLLRVERGTGGNPIQNRIHRRPESTPATMR